MSSNSHNTWDIKRILFGLLNILFIILESSLGGGAFYSLKTGKKPEAIPLDATLWWDYVPSIGIGTVGPVFAALIGYKVVSDMSLTWYLRLFLGTIYVYYTLGYITVTTIYILGQGQPETLTFTETLQFLGLGGSTFVLTWWLLSGNFFLPGAMLAAMYHDKKVEVRDQLEASKTAVQAEALALIKDLGKDKARVYEAIRLRVFATRQELAEALLLSPSRVGVLVKELRDEGLIIGDKSLRNTKFQIADPKDDENDA